MTFPKEPDFFLVGQKPRVRGTCTDVDEQLADPTTLVVTVQDPDGFETTYTYGVDPEVTRASLGIFDALVELTKPGEWIVRFKSLGNRQGADEKKLRVRRSAFTNP